MATPLRFHKFLATLSVCMISIFGLGFAVVLQEAGGYFPCPLCIVQRYLFLLLFIFSATALVLDKTNKSAVFYWLCLFTAIFSVCIALYHLYILYGATSAISCGADPLEIALNQFFLAKWLPTLFMANGNCLDVYPPIFGIDIVIWSALAAFKMLGLTIWIIGNR